MAAVCGFGGMRDHGGSLTFAPRVPEALARLRFRVTFRGRLIQVEIGARRAVYTLHDGEPLEISHHGEAVRLKPGEPLTLDIPAAHPGARPSQPSGREPVQRRPAH
jgi:alpha,alpha-trehalose phosphorylase